MGVGEFLQELLVKKEYRKCLDAAQQLLVASGNSLEDLVEINLAICRSRLNLRDPSLAVAPAMLAKKIAHDTKAYHLLGKVCYAMLTTMFYTNQGDKAIGAGYEYFELVPPEYRIPAEEGMIWLGLATTYGEKLLDHQNGIAAYTRAVRCLELSGDSENSLRSILFMGWNHIELKQFHDAKKCVYQAMLKARGLPRDHWVHQMCLLRRGQLAYAEGDLDRTAVLAHRTLGLGSHYGFEDVRFDAMMLLYRVCLDLKEYKDALGYALAARVATLEARLFWREFEAAEAMTEVIGLAGASVVAELDQEYLATGVDITRYVSESVLKARD